MILLNVTLTRMDFASGLERLPYKPDGYNYWTWRGHKIHYIVQGEGSPIVLIHGFGASLFHWRFSPFCPFFKKIIYLFILPSNPMHFLFRWFFFFT